MTQLNSILSHFIIPNELKRFCCGVVGEEIGMDSWGFKWGKTSWKALAAFKWSQRNKVLNHHISVHIFPLVNRHIPKE